MCFHRVLLAVLLLLHGLSFRGVCAELSLPSGRLSAEVARNGKDHGLMITLRDTSGVERTLFLDNSTTSVRFPACQAGSKLLLESDTPPGRKLLTLFDVAHFKVIDAFFGLCPAYSPDGRHIAFLTVHESGRAGHFSRCLLLYDLSLSPEENRPMAQAQSQWGGGTGALSSCAFPQDPMHCGTILFPPENVASGEYLIPDGCEDFALCPEITSPPSWSPSGNQVALLYHTGSRMTLVSIDLSPDVLHPTVSARELNPRFYSPIKKVGLNPARFFAERIEFLKGGDSVRIHPDSKIYFCVPELMPFDVPLPCSSDTNEACNWTSDVIPSSQTGSISDAGGFVPRYSQSSGDGPRSRDVHSLSSDPAETKADNQAFLSILEMSFRVAEAFESRMPALTAEETCQQKMLTAAGREFCHRTLLSDVMMFKASSSSIWTGIRDVRILNGLTLRGPSNRIRELYGRDPAALSLVDATSSRMNLGWEIRRHFLSPTLALSFFGPSLRNRFVFQPGRERHIDGVPCMEIQFQETARPSLLSVNGTAAPCLGSAWVRVDTGEIVRTHLKVGGEIRGQPRSDYTVDYRRDEGLGLLLPFNMVEAFGFQIRRSSREIECDCHYRNFTPFPPDRSESQPSELLPNPSVPATGRPDRSDPTSP